MSNRNKQASGKMLAGTSEPIIDFLYQDQQRIAALLAQFDPSGYLERIRQIENATRGGSKTGKGALQGNAIVVQTSGEVEISATQEDSEGLEREYDPLWANALAFKGFLTKRGLLKNDIAQAAIGSFVLCHGALTIIDTGPLQNLYATEIGSAVAIKNARESGVTIPDEQISAELEVLRSSPPQIQAHLHVSRHTVWSTLRPEGLVTPAGEMTLKHGVVLEGKWTILGIKDAVPEASADTKGMQAEALAKRYEGFNLISETVRLNIALRHWIGRPYPYYGVTPLLIYRPIER